MAHLGAELSAVGSLGMALSIRLAKQTYHLTHWNDPQLENTSGKEDPDFS